MVYRYCTRILHPRLLHIRRLPPGVGYGLGSGIVSTPSLCGRVQPHRGYDAQGDVTPQGSPTMAVCADCAVAYRRLEQRLHPQEGP